MVILNFKLVKKCGFFFPYRHRGWILECQGFPYLLWRQLGALQGVQGRASISAAEMPGVCLQHLLSNLEGEDSMGVGNPALTEGVTPSTFFWLKTPVPL